MTPDTPAAATGATSVAEAQTAARAAARERRIQAYMALDGAIETWVKECVGPQAMVPGGATRDGISPVIDAAPDTAGWPPPAPAPIPALTAVRHLTHALSGHRQSYAAAARAASMSWTAIADALDLVTPTDVAAVADGIDPGVAAFTWARTGGITDPDDTDWSARPVLCWTCPSCHSTVIDRGPYNHDPADDEDGHTPTCTRHHDDIRASHHAHPAPWDDDTGDYQDDDEDTGGEELDGVGQR